MLRCVCVSLLITVLSLCSGCRGSKESSDAGKVDGDHVAVDKVGIAAFFVGHGVHVLKLTDIVSAHPAILPCNGVAFHAAFVVTAHETTLGTRTLKNGSKGTDVKAMQEFLLQLEYSLPKYGADGEFGSETEKALKAFQRKIGIKQDGLYGSETHQALMDAVADDDEGKGDSTPDTNTPEEAVPVGKQVRIVCGSGSVNIRVGNDTKYGRITSVKDGATFEWIATAGNGWHAIVVNAQIGWVSGKYSKTIE